MTETKPQMLVRVPLYIPEERISDLLCNAIEGGSNYWVATLDRDGKTTRAEAPFRQDVPFAGGYLILVEQGEDAPDGEGRTFKIDRDAIVEGMQVFAEKYPKMFADFLNENDDAETGDTFLQCICFGEAIYG